MDARPADRSDVGASTLTWIASLLWGPGAAIEPEPRRGAVASGDLFVAVPNARSPRFLVPATTRRVAGNAFRQFNDSMALTARLRKSAAAFAFGLGVGARIRGDLIRIAPNGSPTEQPLQTFLGEVFGRTDLGYAVMLGPRLRPNLKPVIQVSTLAGVVLGYLKIGWNPTTEALVDNEARALAALTKSAQGAFAFPALLFSGRWNGMRVSAASPCAHRLSLVGRRHELPELEVLRAVAGVGRTTSTTLSSSPYAALLARRMTRSTIPVESRDRIGGLLERTVARAGGLPIPHGSMHGDFAPWNMTRTAHGPFIWDWERYEASAPVGMDVLHYLLQVQLLIDRRPLAPAMDATLRSARTTLQALGVDERAQEPVVTIYLIDRVLRIVEGRAQGMEVRDRLATEILDFLDGRRRAA
jgi:hypothetical protein